MECRKIQQYLLICHSIDNPDANVEPSIRATSWMASSDSSVGVVRVADAELGAHAVEEAHGVEGILQRHDRALGEPLLDAARHLAELVGVADAHDVERLGRAARPTPMRTSSSLRVVDGADASAGSPGFPPPWPSGDRSARRDDVSWAWAPWW